MRRLGYIVAALMLIEGVAKAQSQGWTADQDGQNIYSANNVASISIVPASGSAQESLTCGSTSTDRIEFNTDMGNDVAFVRMNGTAVGGHANEMLIGNLSGGPLRLATATANVMEIQGASIQAINSHLVTYESGAAIGQTLPTVMEWNLVPSTTTTTATMAPVYRWQPVTIPLTGATNITSAAAFIAIAPPTMTNATPMTISKMATLQIGGPPIAGGSVTITSPLALELLTGSMELDAFAGGGTQCLQVDNNGKVAVSGGACGSGAGTVTGVTGSGGIHVTPATPNPNVTLATFACSAGDFVSSASTSSGLACTTPSYQTWTDGTFTPLPQEPFSTAGAGLAIVDDPGDTATVISLPATGTAGSCTNCSVTFDLFGRETARSSGTAPVTSIGVTDPVTTTGGATPTIGAKFDNVSITLNGGGGLQRAAISGDGTIGVGVNTFALTNIPNDTTMAGDLLATAIAAPATPAAGKGRIYEDSTSKNIAIKNDAGTVNHGAQTVASSAGVALTGLSDAGGWTTQTFQAPLTACTDYVSVSCQGGTSDIGTGGSNSAVQVDAFHESGGGRRPFGNFAAPGTAAVWDGTHVAGYLPLGDLGNDYTAPWVIGMHDGANAAWTTVGAAGFVAGQVVEAVAGNKITTNSLSSLLIGAGLLSKTLSYYVTGVGGGGSSAWLLTSSPAAFGVGGTPIEYPLEIASVKTTISVNSLVNTISCTLTPKVTHFYLTQNGSVVNAVDVVDGTTGVVTSSNSVAGSSSDTWGVQAQADGLPCTGSMDGTVTATVFY